MKAIIEKENKRKQKRIIGIEVFMCEPVDPSGLPEWKRNLYFKHPALCSPVISLGGVSGVSKTPKSPDGSPELEDRKEVKNFMQDHNSVQLFGRITSELETKKIGEKSVSNFSIANNKTYKNEKQEKVEKTSFFDCVAWSGLSDIVTKYCKKGNLVFLTGQLEQDVWTDQDGQKKSRIKVVIDSIRNLTPREAQ